MHQYRKARITYLIQTLDEHECGSCPRDSVSDRAVSMPNIKCEVIMCPIHEGISNELAFYSLEDTWATPASRPARVLVSYHISILIPFFTTVPSGMANIITKVFKPGVLHTYPFGCRGHRSQLPRLMFTMPNGILYRSETLPFPTLKYGDRTSLMPDGIFQVQKSCKMNTPGVLLSCRYIFDESISFLISSIFQKSKCL